jgi:Domain of unknown function (DUF4177)
MKAKVNLIVLVCIICAGFLGWTAYGQRQRSPRIIWEYKAVHISAKESDRMIVILNENGIEGWELIQTNFLSNDGATFFLKRQK